MLNWRQKVVDWDAENDNWGGEKELRVISGKSKRDNDDKIIY